MVLSGRNGGVKVGTNQAVSLSDWSLDIKANTEQIDAFGASGWKSAMYMMSDWSGSASGYWDMTTTTDQSLQFDLQNNILCITAGDPTAVTLDLYVDTTGGAIKHYSGSALISKFSIKTEANGLNKVELSFEGNGTLTYETS